jgi:hypothetical protein
MKLDMLAQILDLDGKPIENDSLSAGKSGAGSGVVTLTLRDVLVTALSAPGEGYAQETPEAKFKRGMLAVQAHTKSVLDVSAEDAAMMKRLVAAAYAPLVVYRVHLALDGNDMAPELNRLQVA